MHSVPLTVRGKGFLPSYTEADAGV
jgi:hypothetical protein